MSEIVLAADHGGFALKKALKEKLDAHGMNALDLGSFTEDSVDYPDYADKVAAYLKENPESVGVLICTTGIGISIAANRHSHIRAGIAYNFDVVRLMREHNDANVIVFGAKFTDPDFAFNCLQTFLKTEASKEDRHRRRVKKLSNV